MNDFPGDNMDHADSFPARFSRMLFERYPDWRQYVVPPNPKWQSKDDIAVEVPSRFVPLCPLRLETMGHQMIISWAGWHTHCGPAAAGLSEDELVAGSLDFVADILSEKYVVAIDWSNGPGGTGGTIEADKLEEELATGWPAIFFQDKAMTLLSWNGTYDRGEFDPAKCR